MKELRVFYCPEESLVTIEDSDGNIVEERNVRALPGSFLHKNITEDYVTFIEEEIFEGHDSWDYDANQDEYQCIEQEVTYPKYRIKSICLPRLFKRYFRLKAVLKNRYQPTEWSAERGAVEINPVLSTLELVAKQIAPLHKCHNKEQLIKEIYSVLKSIDEG